MIKIEFAKVDGKIKFLSVKGHSNSAPKGQDLVCAAVSAVTQGGCNALENPSNFTINCKEGLLEIEEIKEASIHDYVVLETILTQLKSIEEVSKDYVKIIEKGK